MCYILEYKYNASEHPIQLSAPCKGCGTRCSGGVSAPCFTRDTCHDHSQFRENGQIRLKYMK